MYILAVSWNGQSISRQVMDEQIHVVTKHLVFKPRAKERWEFRSRWGSLWARLRYQVMVWVTWGGDSHQNSLASPGQSVSSRGSLVGPSTHTQSCWPPCCLWRDCWDVGTAARGGCATQGPPRSAENRPWRSLFIYKPFLLFHSGFWIGEQGRQFQLRLGPRWLQP